MKIARFLSIVGLILGPSCVVAGIYVLAGLGWALIAAGGLLCLLAAVLTRGLLRVE